MGPDGYIPRTLQRLPLRGGADASNPSADHIASNGSLDSIPWSQPCLVLLGEPGIGKSTEFTNAADIAASAGLEARNLNLGSFASANEFQQDVRLSVQWQAWLNGENCLHLFLGALDEGRLNVPAIGRTITQLLESVKINLPRLKLRISSRVPDWPQDLEGKLQSLFKDNGGCAVYRLLPLNKLQRDQWIIARGLDEKAFTAALGQSEAGALAEIPLTLTLLVNIFVKDKCLPRSKVEIYRKGCRLLCEEINDNRSPNPDPDHRVAVAARIAGCVVFANTTLISTANGLEPTAKGAIAVSELVGETEPVNGNQASVNEAHIRDVLGTGLFLCPHSGCVQFVHRSIVEYLAAEYVRRLIDRPTALRALFFTNASGQSRLYPQLAGTAAWLASIEPSFLEQVVTSDPLVLLQGDTGAFSDAQKSRMVASILGAFASARANDFNINSREQYHKLCHPNLADQLRPAITDKTMGLIPRRFAIDLAAACKVTSLLNSLAALALDTTDNHDLRQRAASAIDDLNDVATIRQIRRLICSDARSDPDDQIRGIVMAALWSRGLIAILRLTKTILPPRQPNLYGAYRIFLDFHLLQQAGDPVANLPIILNHLSRHVQHGDFDRLSDSLIRQSAGLASGSPAVLRALANYLWALCSNNKQLFSNYAHPAEMQNLKADTTLRRKILLAIAALPRLTTFSDCDGDALVSAGLLVAEDYSWLLDKVTTEADAALAQRLAVLISRVYWYDRSGDKLEMLLIAASSCAALSRKFQEIIAPVELNSTQADNQRAEWRSFAARRSAAKQSASAPPGSPIALSDDQFRDRALALLATCEAGRADAWGELDLLLQSGPAGRNGHAFRPDIQDLPGWKLLPAELYPRMSAAAMVYLQKGDPRDAEWKATERSGLYSLAGFRALALLQQSSPTEFNALDAHCLRKWIPTILHFPGIIATESESDIPCRIAVAAYHAVPKIFIAELLNKIAIENSKPELGTMQVLGLLRHCWDERLSSAVRGAINPDNLKPWAVATIIGTLFGIDREKTAGVATDILRRLSDSQVGAGYAELITTELLLNAPELGWEQIWALMRSHPNIGKLAVQRAAILRPYSAEFLAPLAECHVAELFIWLENNYPGSMDRASRPREPHSLGPQEFVGWLKRGILDNLRDRGTGAAISSLNLIGQAFPTLFGLRHTILAAEENLRRVSWTSAQPQDFIQLVAHISSRTVRDAAELQSLLVEILGEINADLQGENPMAPQLWNSQDNQWDPKDENYLSDWLLWQLRLRLRTYTILPLREVEIRRKYGSEGAAGQRVDIYVAALGAETSSQKSELFHVLIEVKGDWHPHLTTALTDQLADRYLADNPCRHGIYLIGWFRCTQYTKQITNGTADWALQKIEAALNEQAARESRPLGNPHIRAFVLNCGLR